MIPAIDIFAGPGGLAEGFSRANFDIRLSIEMDEHAHNTLRFRSFCRKLINARKRRVLNDFYAGLVDRPQLQVDTLSARYPDLWKDAKNEALRATLGQDSPVMISNRIEEALDDADNWVLLGGPPCQAYSLVGRSKMRGTGKKFETDHRHLLYKEYLSIVAAHAPSVFVMENVKGLLSSSHKGELILEQIKRDLKHPRAAVNIDPVRHVQSDLEYELHPLWAPASGDLLSEMTNKDFIVEAQKQNVPQARHRLFIIGLRKDLNLEMQHLKPSDSEVAAWAVLRDLPELHSTLSKQKDLGWLNVVNQFPDSEAGIWTQEEEPAVFELIVTTLNQMEHVRPSGGLAVDRQEMTEPPELPGRKGWYRTERTPVTLNHEARGHMPSDLHRYLFSSAFAEIHGYSPKLKAFPPSLLPAHKNVNQETGEAIFDDRFRTQCKGKPSTTITSHIHKDGHYFIHPEPIQCRSLTVREAARLQTFPDDYLFCGPRTEQFKQVGNAVPPYLAFQIANVIKQILK